MINPNQSPNPNPNLNPLLPSSSPIQVSDASSDAYLMMDKGATSSGSASGSFQNNNDGGGFLEGDNSDVEFGFLRPDLVRQALPLVGTVSIYHRHVFLCYKNPKVWPPHVEAAEFDRLPRLLSAALLARKAEIDKQTRLTICEGHDGTETSNGDVLIFPDMIRYRRLTHFDIDTFVDEVLVNGGDWHPVTPETLTGSYVFVCSHGSRDRRCGVCGPALVARFKEEIDARGFQGQVSVSPCSHIGGHKYAGNVIIFSRSIEGKVTGHWYGYVTPDDVPILLEQHIGKGNIVEWLWRGQMGLSEEEQKKAQELRLQLSDETDMRKDTKPSSVQDFEVGHNGNQVESAACCQGNGNSSACCQNPVLAENGDNNPVVKKTKAKVSKDKNTSDKRINGSISSKGTCTRKVCSMPSWFESWEREDTYAAAAVVGAVVSVAFAYNSYKQLSFHIEHVSRSLRSIGAQRIGMEQSLEPRGREDTEQSISRGQQSYTGRSCSSCMSV